MMAYGLPGVACAHCDAADVVYSKKEEGTGWKVYARCSGCGHDYGRVGFVKMADVDSHDEVDAEAKRLATDRVEAAGVSLFA